MTISKDFKLVFQVFDKKYSKLPGIMTIVEDDALENTILIYFDRDKFKYSSMPASLPTYQLDFIDTYEQHSALLTVFDNLKKHHQNDLSVHSIKHFQGVLSFLKLIIESYEHNLQEKENGRYPN